MALLAIGLVYLVWHPLPLDAAIGVGSIFLIIVAVDVVLGPLLTLVVFKVGKKSLRFDLVVIVALQLVAFGYGLWTISTARPAWLVFNADRFDLAQAYELDVRFLKDAQPEFRSAPWAGPRWVASVAPQNPQKRNDLLIESTMGGSDLPQRVDLYVPLASEAANIRARSKALSELEKYNLPAVVQAALAKWPQADGWLPLMARVQPMVVLVNRAEGKPLAVVDLRPWP